ncbi:hypothetical protein [Bacillus cereus group sp. BfR-BA-01380]|uniref:hypothetical protein n=1 Tax=Bacillus cereus group sp. BfR-BA-01380 TaxID=2920324 RepID=UPI001F581EEF|nr:hypothetical protein [Bacillus cereus group sp. BfR-BA-01380]
MKKRGEIMRFKRQKDGVHHEAISSYVKKFNHSGMEQRTGSEVDDRTKLAD